MAERTSSTRERPAFQGLSLHRDNYLGFSVFRPLDWHRFEWLDGRHGALYGPVPDDNATLFAVAVQDLGTKVTEEDIPDLHMGFITGVGRLPESEIEWQDQWKVGGLIGIEAKYTFREGGERRKRWVRVLYQDTRQITITAQGATPETYDYWLPMFYQSMMTFRVHTSPEYKRQQPRPNPA